MEKVSFAVTIIKNSGVYNITFDFGNKDTAKEMMQKILTMGIREYDIESGLHVFYPPSQITKVTTSCADLFYD